MKTQCILTFLCCRVVRRVVCDPVFVSLRATRGAILGRFVPEMTVCVTFGAPLLDVNFRSDSKQYNYITFSTPFGPLCPATQEIIWFDAHALRRASGRRRGHLVQPRPSTRSGGPTRRRRRARALHGGRPRGRDRAPRSGSSAAPAFIFHFHGQRRCRWGPPSFRVGGVRVAPVLEKILRF